MKTAKHIDQQLALELFEYRDGRLFWKVSRRGIWIGRQVRTPHGGGYLVVGVKEFGGLVLVHRVVWTMHHGAIPKGYQIDHINGDRADNRIENLRVVPQELNMRNVPRGNGSGICGVHRKGKSWRAHVSLNNHTVYIGTYPDYFEACCARKSAEAQHGFTSRHGR
jgi:hypothetical protein